MLEGQIDYLIQINITFCIAVIFTYPDITYSITQRNISIWFIVPFSSTLLSILKMLFLCPFKTWVCLFGLFFFFFTFLIKASITRFLTWIRVEAGKLSIHNWFFPVSESKENGSLTLLSHTKWKVNYCQIFLFYRLNCVLWVLPLCLNLRENKIWIWKLNLKVKVSPQIVAICIVI